jgi:CRISPR-associated endonuclease Csn1
MADQLQEYFEYLKNIKGLADTSIYSYMKHHRHFKDQEITQKNIEKVIDVKLRRILTERLKEYDNDPKKAFANLEENPIWINKEKDIQLKRVTITGVSNAEPLHVKKDHFGNEIIDENGKPLPVDFVSTGNNHHVAVYRDKKGDLQEKVVSFFEAVARVNAGIPIILKSPKEVWNMVLEAPDGKYPQKLVNNFPDENWQFIFTMKQNEMFVFPNQETDFNPEEIDLTDEKNYQLISPNLFRVQKIATKNYMFRNHLETSVEDNSNLKDITFRNHRNTNALKGIIGFSFIFFNPKHYHKYDYAIHSKNNYIIVLY